MEAVEAIDAAEAGGLTALSNQVIRWSLVSLTRWCALTQASQRSSAHSLHRATAFWASSQDLQVFEDVPASNPGGAGKWPFLGVFGLLSGSVRFVRHRG